MRIGCIYSVDDFTHKLPTFSTIPFGISYIAMALKQAGHDPKLLVATPSSNLSALIGDYLRAEQPRLMCLTAVSTQYRKIQAIAQIIKEHDPDVFVILGGHHATLNPDEAIKCPDFDAICIGEGEKAVAVLAASLERGEKPGGINNLWIKSGPGTEVEKNPPDPFIQDLDALPPIDLGLWDEWVEDKNRMVSILVGRGCPNRCTYCSNHALVRVARGKYVRMRSVENVITELQSLLERYPGLSSIFLEAETLAAKIDYVLGMCEALEKFNAGRSRPVSFGANLAVSKQLSQNEELMTRLQKANFEFVNIGLESGSERVRNEILKRPPYTNQEFLAFCRLARKYGIACNIFALVGIPGETVGDFQETVAVVRAADPQHVFLGIFYPYPGTDLHTRAKEMGLLTSDILDPTLERQRATMDLPGFSKRQIQHEYLWFTYKIYKGKKPIINILIIMARIYMGTSPRLNSIYRAALANKYVNKLKDRFATASR